jgi:tRNA pseudouridine13 synthase
VKLKCQPDDFQVDELTGFPVAGGPFAVYLLEKRTLGTPEAIDQIVRKWKMPRSRISYGGLKDKHAVTRQYVTVHNGPRRELRTGQFSLTYLGQSTQPFTPHAISGNRFAIVIRDLSDKGANEAAERFTAASRDGVPNYFDDQRFGSVGESGEFIAGPWCRGDFERALWLVLADPHPDDRSEEKEQKRILREHWGRWPAAKAALAPSNRRSIVTYLVDKPGDFRGAFARLRVDMRSLYLAAFQSHLWNELAAEYLRQTVGDANLSQVRFKRGGLPFPLRLSDEQRAALLATQLPLPSSRLHLEPGPLMTLFESVLGRHGLALRELRVKYPRDSFFSKGDRPLISRPTETGCEIAADELYPGKRKLSLRMVLARGCYATVVVKAITNTAAALTLD